MPLSERLLMLQSQGLTSQQAGAAILLFQDLFDLSAEDLQLLTTLANQ